MAHFHFKQRSLVAAPPSIAPWRRSLSELPAQHEPEFTKGPGWFDSSWDLQRGLQVREGLPGDAQLHEWLDVWLRDDRLAPAKSGSGRQPAAARRAAAPTPVAAPPRDVRFDAFDLEGLDLA